MNIGVIGWWNYGNEGDFRILESLRRSLAPHHLVPFDAPFRLTADAIRRLNLLDFVLIGGGGLFIDGPPQPFDTFHRWADQLQTPLGVVGVGVDAIASEKRPALEALVKRARFFYVRDRNSLLLIAHPKASLISDLTFLHAPHTIPDARDQTLHDPPLCGINLREMPNIEMDAWVTTLRETGLNFRGVPLSTYGAWSETALLRQIDPTCAQRFSPDLYEGLDLMIGTAFHSVVFAIQHAIPVIAIAYAPKVPRLMRELGLHPYVLVPSAWDRLPALVERVLGERKSLVRRLHAASRRLRNEARRTFTDVRAQIEMERPKSLGDHGKVSMVVLGSTRTAFNERTLASCHHQTYPNVEIIFVQENTAPVSTGGTDTTLLVAPAGESNGARLNRALEQATGQYYTWTTAGNVYAPDAVACMLDRLANDRACDLVYADYYTVHAHQHIAETHFAERAEKLHRRDVVGPCFLYRRRLHERAGAYQPDTALPAYDFWLRARDVGSLQPLHVPLFYQHTANVPADQSAARSVRRVWRQKQALHQRLFWQALDNHVAETLIIRPLVPLWHRFRSSFNVR